MFVVAVDDDAWENPSRKVVARTHPTSLLLPFKRILNRKEAIIGKGKRKELCENMSDYVNVTISIGCLKQRSRTPG